jgi:YidC/Oxa1 family membrane protein insertase
MDRNSILGIVLIAAIFIVWGIFNKPNQEELRRAQLRNDSIALVQKKQELEKEIKAIEVKQGITDQKAVDTLKTGQLKQDLGVFSNEANGENKIYTLENDLIKFKISQKGGRPYSVELKK